MKWILLKDGRIKLPPGSFKAGLYAVLSFLILASVIITVGSLYYLSYARHYRAEAGRDLLAITELKVSELERYRTERLADGNILCKNPAFSRLVRRFFDQPEDEDAQRQLNVWLGKIKEYYGYNGIFLLDTQAVERLTIPAATGSVPDRSVHIAEAFRAGQAVFFGFHRHGPDQPVFLSVAVPLFDEADETRPLGAVILQIDPQIYLYPLLRRWPTPSESAETLIVRREGNEAVFLNELRFQTNAALNLSISLTHTDLPAAKAVLGQEGIVKGVDYRGAPVLAALKAIPDSPWFMVARQDIAEIYAPIKTRLWQAIIMTIILLIGTAGGVGFIWRHQRVSFYREKAEMAEALRETNDYLENLISYANAPIVVWDATGRITRFNHAFEAIAGRKTEDVLGQKMDILFADDQREQAMAIVGRAGAGERFDLVEVPIQHTSGSSRTVLWNSAPIFGPDGKTQVATIAQGYDITKRKKSEQKLAETMENLIASNRDLEQFAYVASHDLQEPLRMIANYMQLLERRYKDQLDQDAKEFIGFAVDGAVRMQQLIDSLLEYSRLHSRKKPFESVDLNQVLRRVLRDLEGRILDAEAQITFEPLPNVVGDAVQLGLVFQNLISNALKFRGEKSPEIHISTEEFSPSTGLGAGNHWKITVRDNGIGIAPEHQARIFNIFQRLHSRAEYSGTGIGLSICKRVIERHHGETFVESSVGNGSSFWFTLPKQGGE